MPEYNRTLRNAARDGKLVVYGERKGNVYWRICVVRRLKRAAGIFIVTKNMKKVHKGEWPDTLKFLREEYPK